MFKHPLQFLLSLVQHPLMGCFSMRRSPICLNKLVLSGLFTCLNKLSGRWHWPRSVSPHPVPIWPFFLDPCHMRLPPRFSRNQRGWNNQWDWSLPALSIWPRPPDSCLDFLKKIWYNKSKKSCSRRRELEILKIFCYNIIIQQKKGKMLWNFMKH